MFPQFGATADTLSKASTLVFRIGTDAHLYDDPEDVSIAPLLDSKFDSEKCEALKRLLALIAQGFDVSNFFPQVVKNVATQSLEVKKLVYLYLLHYAQKRPNEALLSINCFQKDLGDPNPLVRAWALRAMAGIRLHVIAPLVVVAVGKCARDPSVYVRKCAANALPKLNDLRLDEYTAGIEEVIGILLNDNSPCVVGAAAAAFSSICPTNLSLIGRNYRRLCEILPDIEEWGQIVLIGILLRYVIARHGFVQGSIMASLHHTENSKSQNDFCDTNSVLEDNGDMSGLHESELANVVFRCYIEGPDEYLSRVGFMNKDFSQFNPRFTSGNNNEDVKFLLRCTSPLLWSNNSAVVLAAAGVHWIMSPMEEVKRIVKPLLFVQRSSTASKYVVLCNIQVFAKAIPSLFSPYFEDFFICSSDSYQIKALKLDILAHIATDSSIPFVLKEFQDYIRDPDRRFAADTVAGIGICAQRLPKMANTCLEFLLALTRQQVMTGEFGSVEGEANILIQAIMSIKSIVQRDPPSHEKVIIQLVRSLNLVKVPAARAMIVWMVGEYNSLGDIIPRMLTTVLKYLARCFTSEELETKLQICNTTVKVLLRAEGGNDRSTIQKVLSYVLELAKCDLSYDVRDRAYFLKNLLSSYLDSQGLKEENIILSQNKDIPCVLAKYLFGGQTKSNSPEPIDHRFYLPGSLSQIVLHAAPGYEPLPKPCTMLSDGLEINEFGEGVTNSDTYVTDDQNSVSESLDEENSSRYSSQHSNDSGSEEDGSASEDDDNSNPLIQLMDVGNAHEVKNGASQSASDFGELLSNRALESWLDEQPGFSSSHNPEQSQVHRSSARISIGDIGGQVKPKSCALLDPVNGNGLKVDYSFSSEISDISPLFICIEVSFKNCSNEIMSDIYLVDEESDKGTDSGAVTHESSMISQNNASNLASVEEITSLESGQTVTRIIQVRFHHHLLPLKLTLYCNGKKLPVKLRPDIGYFVRALPLDVDAFTIKESHLRGMFECTRRCNFIDHIEDLDKNNGDKSLVEDKFLVICRSLALKMLSNANLYLVSVDMPVATKLDDATGLCLRFSSKLLSTSVPCLITITVEGRCSEPLELTVKVNCEETVFGLNLLNRIVNFLG